jgi:hypothetical protein
MSKRFLSLINVTNGGTLPSADISSEGDIFFRTDVKRMYVFNGLSWDQLGGDGGGGGGVDLAYSFWVGV